MARVVFLATMTITSLLSMACWNQLFHALPQPPLRAPRLPVGRDASHPPSRPIHRPLSADVRGVAAAAVAESTQKAGSESVSAISQKIIPLQEALVLWHQNSIHARTTLNPGDTLAATELQPTAHMPHAPLNAMAVGSVVAPVAPAGEPPAVVTITAPTTLKTCCGLPCDKLTSDNAAGDAIRCCHDPEDELAFLRMDKSKPKARAYIVINEARSGSSWLQEMSIRHPQVLVQFELSSKFGDKALDCQMCHRSGGCLSHWVFVDPVCGLSVHTPLSKDISALVNKRHPPQACGLTLFGSRNNIEEVREIAQRKDAVFVILLRRNHLALVHSSYKHFNLSPKEKKAFQPGLEFWADKEWLKQLTATAEAYDGLLRYALDGGRDTLIIFYEELAAEPQLTWNHFQEYLQLPNHEIASLYAIHEKASTHSSVLQSMNPDQLNRMRESNDFARWMPELTNQAFFSTKGEWLSEFKSLCSKFPNAANALKWSGHECVNRQVKQMI